MCLAAGDDTYLQTGDRRITELETVSAPGMPGELADDEPAAGSTLEGKGMEGSDTELETVSAPGMPRELADDEPAAGSTLQGKGMEGSDTEL